MTMKEQTALWLGIQDLKYEISSLREALEKIKKTVEEAQDPIVPSCFILDSNDGAFILETAENALKGNEK